MSRSGKRPIESGSSSSSSSSRKKRRSDDTTEEEDEEVLVDDRRADEDKAQQNGEKAIKVEKMKREKSGKSEKREETEEEEDEEGGDEEGRESEGESSEGEDAASRFQERNKMINRGKHADYGILKSIMLENFMNHKKFKLDFHPNITVITGKNGSGKSAILAAIQVAFGATTVHRGTKTASVKVANMIRHDADRDFARITLVIKNEGKEPGPFRQTTYGKEIRIVRTIRKQGAHAWEFQNERGQKVAAKGKDEIKRIRDHFAIQIDNPCCIMNQDQNILAPPERGKDGDKQKYDFFMSATMLSELKDKIDSSKDKLERAQKNLHSLKDIIPVKEKAMEKWKKRWDQVQNVREKQERVIKLQRELLWANVLAAENKHLQLDSERKTKLLPKVEKVQEQIEDLVLAINKEKEELKKFDPIIEQHRKELEEVDAKSGLKQDIKAAQHAVKEAESEVRSLKAKCEQRRGKERKIQAKMDELKQAAKVDMVAEQRAKQDALDKLYAEKREITSQLDQKEKELKEYEEMRRECKQKMDTAKSNLDSLNEELKQAKNLVQNLSRSKSYDPLSRFRDRDQIEKVRKEIQKQHFDHPPIGPLGVYIKIKPEKKEWQKPIEIALQKAKSHWVTFSVRDRKKLTDICNRIYGKYNETIYETTLTDAAYPIQRQPGDVTTVYDCLNFEDVRVHNALVDVASPELIGLEESTDAGQKIMEGQRGFRTTCQAFYDRHGSVVSFKGKMVLVVTDQDKIGTVLTTSTGDVKEQLQEAKQQQRELETQFRECEKEYKRLNGQLNKLDNTKKQVLLRQKALKSRQDGKDREIKMEEERETEEEQDNEQELKQLQSEWMEAANAAKELQGRIKDAEQVVQEKKEVMHGFETRAKEDEKVREAIQKKIKKSQLELKALSFKVEEKQMELEKFNKIMEKRKKELEQNERLLGEEKRKIEATTKLAIAAAPDPSQQGRLVVKKSVLNIEAEIKALKRSVEAEQKRLDASGEKKLSNAEIQEHFQRAEKAFSEAKIHFQMQMGNVGALQKSLDKRNKEVELFREAILWHTQQNFHRFMAKQGHSGSVKINKEAEKLQLSVTMHALTRQSQSQLSQGKELTKRTENLSGGEQAYTALAFITAVGEAVAAPFRCMDEYDAAMDAMNKQVSTNLLLDVCTSHRHRQFIFFTPNDITAFTKHEAEHPDHLITRILPDPPRDFGQPRITDVLQSQDNGN